MNDVILSERPEVITERMDCPIQMYFDKQRKGQLDTKPIYQREYVIDKKKASKLIESVILGIPIPSVFLCEENDGSLSVIDGQQRLTSFIKYLNNEYPLENLKELPFFNNKRFRDLEQLYQNKIEDTVIPAIRVEF